jgi:hypothetical protein
MRKNCRIFLICFAIFFFSFKSIAQNQQLISGVFKQLSFEQFADSIEQKTNYHFYFNPSDLDGFYVNLTVDKKPLNQVLQSAFSNTDIQFAIDSRNRIFITRRFAIITQLPLENMQQRNPTGLSHEAERDSSPGNGDSKAGKGLSLENKLIQIGIKDNGNPKGTATLTGYVWDAVTGEAVTSAAVYVDKIGIGVVTDQFGYYTIEIPRGLHTLRISSVGMKDTRRQIMVNSSGKLNIDLQNFIPSLKAVVIVGNKNSNVKGVQMGVERLSIKTIKQLPMAFGEADVLKAVLTLPGVTSVGEASTGLNVRGGSTDQNLILFNDATIYNPSHLFGFFSAFNPDVVQDVQLYKSSIPEKYGGRLSSVLDVSARSGNKKKFSGSGGISPLTAGISLEGPIIKDKTTYVFGARSSYSDWMLHNIQNKEFAKSQASFYDFALTVSHEINTKNNLYLTGYLSNDQFKLNSDTMYKYNNRNVNLKWKHIFNDNLVGIFVGGLDSYHYNVSSKSNPVNAFGLAFDVKQTFFKADFTYTPNSKHTIAFGVNSIYYKLNPGSLTPEGDKSLVVPDIIRSEQGLESAAYIGDHFDISPNFSINAGLRYSMYNYLGAQTVFTYQPGLPRDEFTIMDTVNYGAGANIKTYSGPEYRISARYNFSPTTSVKISYNTLRQYIHMLSNSVTMSPTDIWKLSDLIIKPQTGEQISLGLYGNFKSNTIETSVEVYYKNIDNFLDYKSGAKLLLNQHIETDIINTRGKAYGIELMVKKKTGKLNGWINYTYSRSLIKMDDPIAGEMINNGEYYPTNFDKPNVANLVGNYRLSHRVSFSFNAVYSTGRPVTLPIAIYDLAGSQRVYYSNRNQYRVPDYFRMDLSMNIDGNHKVKQLIHGSLSFGVYNLTGRKNAYSVYFTAENGVIKGYKLSIFGTAIPFITYNFRF